MSINDTVFPLDPFTQSLSIIDRDGQAINITIPDINDLLNYSVQISINYAAQFGASLVLLLVLLLLTRPEKRKAPVFVLNGISLVVNLIRILLFVLYFTSPFVDIYAYFALDYSRVPASAYGTQVGAAVLTLILLALVEASLCLQVRVVLITLRSTYRRIIFSFSVVVASLAITFRLAYCIENAKYIVSLQPLDDLQWMGQANNICTTVSICWFCLVFCTKLGMSIRERKRLGVGQWGPTQIIFIMGCQTLVIPALFSILQFATTVPAISSNVLTTVVIFLPLSSLWASASTHTSSTSSSSFPTHGNPSHRSSNTFHSGTTALGYTPTLKEKIFGTGASGYGTAGPVIGLGGPSPPPPHQDGVDGAGQEADDRRSRPGWLSPDSAVGDGYAYSMQDRGVVERDLEAQGLGGVVEERKGVK